MKHAIATWLLGMEGMVEEAGTVVEWQCLLHPFGGDRSRWDSSVSSSATGHCALQADCFDKQWWYYQDVYFLVSWPQKHGKHAFW